VGTMVSRMLIRFWRKFGESTHDRPRFRYRTDDFWKPKDLRVVTIHLQGVTSICLRVL
jgi:hypothetical protein